MKKCTKKKKERRKPESCKQERRKRNDVCSWKIRVKIYTFRLLRDKNQEKNKQYVCFSFLEFRLNFAYSTTLVDKWESIDSVVIFNVYVQIYVFDTKYMAKKVIKRVISIIGFSVCQTNKLKYSSTNTLYSFFFLHKGKAKNNKTARFKPHTEFMDDFHNPHTHTRAHSHSIFCSSHIN